MVDHFIFALHAGCALPLSVPVNFGAVTEDATGGLFYCVKKAIALFLEFLTCFD
jgi:hypothetical protein